jgi:phosphoribosylamine--glycine ligase
MKYSVGLRRTRACAGLEDGGKPAHRPAFCAPGNAGIAREAECVALDIADHAAVIAFCRNNGIDFVVVGPEAPLCAGIVDDLEAAGIKAFGPSRAAARLEGSKGLHQGSVPANGIPTAAYERFRAADPAKAYVRAAARPSSSRPTGLPPARASSWRKTSPRPKPPST